MEFFVKKADEILLNEETALPLHFEIHYTQFVTTNNKTNYSRKIKQENKMKKGIHPENYRTVIFKDMSNGDMFLSRSTAKSNETEVFEGVEYPVIKLEISSSSHPFYTGKAKLVDTAGRVDKFMNRYKVLKK